MNEQLRQFAREKAHWATYPGIQVFCNFSLCLLDCEWDIVFVENHFLPRTKERLRNRSVVFAHLNLVGRQALCVRNSGFFPMLQANQDTFDIVFGSFTWTANPTLYWIRSSSLNMRATRASKTAAKSEGMSTTWFPGENLFDENGRVGDRERNFDKKQTSYRYERRIPLGVERDSVKSERDLLAKGSRSILGQTERLLYVLSQG